ncbi:sensor histidine kinase [Thiomicrorhabdus indica]|uniref:sensor histidine kinase n=1 Tax=Thiomicrorhabdus indica TaxID=2267253 RepID=UPI00102DDC95|nr:ATP-binding protein [Thiomicrorhabdus indica]
MNGRSLNSIFRFWVLLISLVTVALGFVTIALYQQTQKLYQMNEFNLNLSQDTTALILLANERLVNDTGRFQKQLEDAASNLKQTLYQSRFAISEADSDLLLVYLSDIRFLLKRYHIFNNHLSKQNIQRSSYDGVMAKIYGMDAEVNRITGQAQQEFKDSAQLFMIVLGFFLLVMLVLPLMTLKKLRWQLIGALQQVSDSARRMIDHKFKKSIEETPLLEINQLVSTLNNLRTRLLKEMASREDLEVEIEARIHAETEARKLLQDLQRNQAQMVQMEKLSAMGTMVGGVAHELNNPLMGIMNYIQYSQKRCEDEKAKKMLLRAQDEVSRVQSLVKNMLIFSRSKQDVEMRVIELLPIIEQVIELFEGSFKKLGIHIDLQVPDKLRVRANEDLLKQVLVNLLGNARDAIQSEEKPVLSVVWLHEKEQEGLCIIDNGGGIPKKVQEQIFDPFFTTKPVGQGTGLGLSISKEMATTMNAELKLLSTSESGTKFILGLQKVDEG